MDGRWTRWAWAGLMAGGVGCNAARPAKSPGPDLPGQPGLLSKAFGGGKFVPQAPPPDEPVARPARKPGQGLKPETEVDIAAAEVEAAFMPTRPGVEKDQLLDTARQRYQRALAADPKSKPALAGLARLYAQAGDKDKAVAALHAAQKAHPKDHALAHRTAAVQAQFGDWAGAAEACRYALALDPENRVYHKTLGYCQANLGQWQEAGETLVRGGLSEAQTRYFLGRVLVDHGRADEGREMVRQAAALEPEHAAAKQFLDDLAAGRAGAVVQAAADQPAGER